MAMSSSAGVENAALIAARLKAIEETLQENTNAMETRALSQTMESVTESRVAQVHTLKTCLELNGNHARLAQCLKENMTPCTLRAIAVTADTMMPREHAIYDEAFIALVASVRGLKPQAVRDLFMLPTAVTDVALDTSLPDLPFRIHRMMTWANSVEHAQIHDMPVPDEALLLSLSPADVTDEASELSASVLEFFYPRDYPLQIQPGCEVPCSHALNSSCQALSPDTIQERKSFSESIMGSNLTDYDSRDENEPSQDPVWRACNNDLEGPFQTVSGTPGPLSERHLSPLQSLNSGSSQSPDAPQGQMQPALQGDPGLSDTPKGKHLCTITHVACVKPGDSNSMEAFSNVEAGRAVQCEACLRQASPNRVMASSRNQELQDQENNPNTSVLDGSVQVSELGPGAAQVAPTDNFEAPNNTCTTDSHVNDCCCAAEDLFPETNFEDSEEDDGGCMEMFKSCMNDHSVYDTKRSRVLELSDCPASTLADDAENSAALMEIVTSGISGMSGSTADNEAQLSQLKNAGMPQSGSQAGLGERNKSCTSITTDSSDTSAAALGGKTLDTGDMAARLKAKLRTRASASSHIAAARGKKARAHRQKAARASEGHSTGCLATKGTCSIDAVSGDQGSLQASCTCCQLPTSASEVCQAAVCATPEQSTEQHPLLSASSSTELSGSALPSEAQRASGTIHVVHATGSQPNDSVPESMPIANVASLEFNGSPATATASSAIVDGVQAAHGAPEPVATCAQEAPVVGPQDSNATNNNSQEKESGVAALDPEVVTPAVAHGLPCSSVPGCVEGIPGGPEAQMSAAPNIALFPTAESFSCAAGSILTSVVANYVITSIPELMYTVCGQLTYDQVAQLLPALACSSGLVAVLSGEPATIGDGRAAPFLLEICQKRYPNMKIPADLSAAIDQDTHHARVIIRHVLKVSERGEQFRREEELAAKQASKGKKKSSKKVKAKKYVEELDVQAIMLDLFQELLPQDCRLPMTMDHVHQLPMVKELLGSLPPLHSDDHTAAASLSMPVSMPPVNDIASQQPAASIQPTASHQPTPPSAETPVSPQPVTSSSPPSIPVQQEQEHEEAVSQKHDAPQAPSTSKVTPGGKPCGLRKLPPRSKKPSESNPACQPAQSPGNAAECPQSHSTASNPAQARTGAEPPSEHLPGVYWLTRMCCMRVDELIATWPAKAWCQVPSAGQIQAVLNALAAVRTSKSSAADSKAMAEAAQEAARKLGLSDEALIYTLSTLSAPGCHQACHELVWNNDGRYRACALRLPPPNFTQAGASPASVNSWMLPQARPNLTGCMGKPVVHETVVGEASNAGATFMEPPPRDFDIEHPKMQAWADRVAADIVSRRAKDCDSVKATLSQIIQHLGLESFLEVTVKFKPDEQFKQGNMEVAMLHHRYSTEGVDVPPQQSWCMTLGGLDSLQVNYQPRASDAQLKCPCIPFECSGVDEAVKEHLGRCTVQGAAEEVAATMQTGAPSSSILSLSAAAMAPGQRSRSSSTATAKAKNTDGARQHAATGMFSKVWREVSKPLMGSGNKSKEPEPSEMDTQTSDGTVLASADADSAPRVSVEGDVLAGAVKMDADTLAGAAGLHKQCRMM